MTTPAPAADAIGTADRLTIAVVEAARGGRAMPLAPADMALARPDLWATAKAAERFLEARAGNRGFGGFKTLIAARYRKGLRGRWSAALVPIGGSRAALEAIVGPVAAYEVEGVDAAPQVVPAVSPAAQRVRLAALAQRLDDVRPRREWGVRDLDWRACEIAARAAAALPGAKWREWRDQVQMVGSP
jgi:hypothetical protein